jgi:hypothetical protein
MADALAQAAPSSLAAQESRRLELDRARRRSAQQAPPPVGLDQGVLDVPFARQAALNLQERGAARLEDQPNRSAPASVDQAIANESREQRLQTGLMQARGGRGQEGGSSAPQGGASLGRMAGAAAGAGGGTGAALANAAGGGGIEGAAGGMGQRLGTGIIKGCWEAMAPTFGLTVIILDIMFFLGYSSKFFRKYIPEIGHEWIPEQARQAIPKSVLLPIKYAELSALVLVTALVAAALTILFFMLVYLISVLMAVAQGLT